MTYPIITARRMPYDIDGSEVGYRFTGTNDDNTWFNLGIETWLNSTQKGKLNSHGAVEDIWNSFHFWEGHAFWWFFPESREITHIAFLHAGGNTPDRRVLQGSNDSSNGIDGTWETAAISWLPTNTSLDNWRANILAVSFSEPKKVLRLAFSIHEQTAHITMHNIHVYGHKAAGQTPDDILFTNGAGTELSSLKDWGDQPEGTTEIEQVFYIKNASTTKQANSVNLQLNHADFGISFSADGPWVSVLDISSIAPGALSAPVYIKNALGPPLLVLGPRAARVIATVGSWS